MFAKKSTNYLSIVVACTKLFTHFQGHPFFDVSIKLWSQSLFNFGIIMSK